MTEYDDLSPLIIALDTSDLEQARRWASAVRENVDVVKVGLELYSAAGPKAVEVLKGDGFDVFLDLKLNDIPNTVASACLTLCELEPLFMTLHTMGGQEMMRAASSALAETSAVNGKRRPRLLGVTVLTSLDLLALKKIGVRDSMEGQVTRLAKLAVESGLDGVVASPLEVLDVRRIVGTDPVVVTPGVRPPGARIGDHARVATPGDAVNWGSDFLVVGRPLTRSEDPASVARAILEDARRRDD